jgi:hypothetical protein
MRVYTILARKVYKVPLHTIAVPFSGIQNPRDIVMFAYYMHLSSRKTQRKSNRGTTPLSEYKIV